MAPWRAAGVNLTLAIQLGIDWPCPSLPHPRRARPDRCQDRQEAAGAVAPYPSAGPYGKPTRFDATRRLCRRVHRSADARPWLRAAEARRTGARRACDLPYRSRARRRRVARGAAVPDHPSRPAGARQGITRRYSSPNLGDAVTLIYSQVIAGSQSRHESVGRSEVGGLHSGLAPRRCGRCEYHQVSRNPRFIEI